MSDVVPHMAAHGKWDTAFLREHFGDASIEVRNIKTWEDSPERRVESHDNYGVRTTVRAFVDGFPTTPQPNSVVGMSNMLQHSELRSLRRDLDFPLYLFNSTPEVDAPHPALVSGPRWTPETQAALSRAVAERLGYSFAHGRLDVSTHPFTGGAGPQDVRMTTRYSDNWAEGHCCCLFEELGCKYSLLDCQILCLEGGCGDGKKTPKGGWFG